MGMTNIRSGHGLLGRAGCDQDEVALIPSDIMRSIYLEARSISEEELETYSNFLVVLRSDQDRWLDVRGRPLEIPAGKPVLPQAVIAPKVVLSPGLSSDWIQSAREIEEEQPEDLAFIAIVQGLAGASLSKVVMRYSAYAIGTAMFYELINGYSTVFSGVFLKSEDKCRSSSNVLWQKVETYDELLQTKISNEGPLSSTNQSSPNRSYKIGIVC